MDRSVCEQWVALLVWPKRGDSAAFTADSARGENLRDEHEVGALVAMRPHDGVGVVLAMAPRLRGDSDAPAAVYLVSRNTEAHAIGQPSPHLAERTLDEAVTSCGR